eukprot:358484_1
MATIHEEKVNKMTQHLLTQTHEVTLDAEELTNTLAKHETLTSAMGEIQDKYSTDICKAIAIDIMLRKSSVNFKDVPVNLKHPQPFTPTIAELIGKTNWHDIAKQDAADNFKIRIIRIICSKLNPLVFLIIASIVKIAFARMIGFMLLVMFTGYFIIVLSYVFSVGRAKCGLCKSDPNDTLHRIYSVSKKPNHWANINTCFVQLVYEQNSVQSISELSAINGGVPKVLLNLLGSYAWTAIVAVFAAELYYNDNFK